jgi:hypothetical protein
MFEILSKIIAEKRPIPGMGNQKYLSPSEDALFTQVFKPIQRKRLRAQAKFPEI